MSLDGFLTFLTLAVAIYALMPAESRLRVRLAFLPQSIAAISFFLLVIYLEFFDVFGRPCAPALGRAPCALLSFSPQGLKPEQVAFVSVLLWLFTAAAIYKWWPPTASTLPTLQQLIEALIHEQRYAELCTLTQRYLPLITAGSRRRLNFQRLHDWATRLGRPTLIFDPALDVMRVQDDAWYSRIYRSLLQMVSWLAVLIPAQRSAERAANGIARILFCTDPLTKFIAKARPYFGVSLIGTDVNEVYDFTDEFLGRLMSERGSVLYQELQPYQNAAPDMEHEILGSNRLLYALFHDATVAERLHVWKPIGEHLLKLLGNENEQSEQYIRELNRPFVDGENHWDDPATATITFFDVMVTTSAYQAVNWHMWLYYVSYFVEKLVIIYRNDDSSIVRISEFPTRSAFLIYAMIDKLIDWVRLIRYLPEDSAHLNIPEHFERDNGNIPVSAAICTGDSLFYVLRSEALPSQFRYEMHEKVLRAIASFARDGLEGRMRRFMIEATIQAAHFRPEGAYLRALRDAFAAMDRDDQKELDDYKAALDAKA